MHDALAKGIMQMDIIDREAIQTADITPALPPASSDNHKWWLDDGMFFLCFIYIVWNLTTPVHILFLSPSVLV